MNFYDFYNKIQGEPYEDTPKPYQYELEDYMKDMSTSGEEYGGAELKPLSMDDMSQASEEDVLDWRAKNVKSNSLGEPLDDEGMRKYTGIREFVEQQEKPWKAKRKEIIEFWQSMRPNSPVNIRPVPANHTEKSRYRYDGIRLSGSTEFINSVISRFKDLIQYDQSEQLKLDVEYRQIETPEGERISEPSYVFYLHLIEKS